MSVEEVKLTEEEKEALAPFANTLHGMLSPLRHYPTGDLEMLITAADKLNQTNCWFREYEVGPLVAKEAKRELYQRYQRTRHREGDQQCL